MLQHEWNYTFPLHQLYMRNTIFLDYRSKCAEKGMKGVKNVFIKTTRKQGLGYTMTTKTTYEYTNKNE